MATRRYLKTSLMLILLMFSSIAGFTQTIVNTALTDVLISYYQKNNSGATSKKEETADAITVSFNEKTGSHELLESITISKNNSDYVSGDVDGDGFNEIVTSVSTYEGGNNGSKGIFVIKNTNGKYIILASGESTKLCGCTQGAFNNDFTPQRIEGGVIVGKAACWAPKDPHCCPSLFYITKVKANQGKLVFVSKEKAAK